MGYRRRQVGISVQRVFQLENGRNLSHFTLSQKSESTRGLVPLSTSSTLLYTVQFEKTIWEVNNLIETPKLGEHLAKQLHKLTEKPCNFLIKGPPSNTGLCSSLLIKPTDRLKAAVWVWIVLPATASNA